jgi:hypothetical protein
VTDCRSDRVMLCVTELEMLRDKLLLRLFEISSETETDMEDDVDVDAEVSVVGDFERLVEREAEVSFDSDGVTVKESDRDCVDSLDNVACDMETLRVRVGVLEPIEAVAVCEASGDCVTETDALCDVDGLRSVVADGVILSSAEVDEDGDALRIEDGVTSLSDSEMLDVRERLSSLLCENDGELVLVQEVDTETPAV